MLPSVGQRIGDRSVASVSVHVIYILAVMFSKLLEIISELPCVFTDFSSLLGLFGDVIGNSSTLSMK